MTDSLLNTINAERYTQETIPGALAGTATMSNVDGTPVVVVPFTIPAENFTGSMDVWVENGTLYGEW